MAKKRKNRTDTEAPARTIAILFIVGVGVMVGVGMQTLITGLFISRICVVFMLIFSAIPRKFYPFIFRIRPRFRVLLNLAGLAPIATALVLTLNFLIPLETYQESYKVKHTVYYHYDEQFEVQLDNDAMAVHNQLRRFKKTDYPGIHDSVHFTLQKGLFGMKVVKDKRITMKYKD